MCVRISLQETEGEIQISFFSLVKNYYRVQIGIKGNSKGLLIFIEPSTRVNYFQWNFFILKYWLRILLLLVGIIDLYSGFNDPIMKLLKSRGFILNEMWEEAIAVNSFQMFSFIRIWR